MKNALVATLAALQLLLAACGGDKALTRSEWIAKAEAICTRTGVGLDKLDPDSFDSRTKFARAVDDIFGAGLADLRALRAPRDDQATIREWLGMQEALAGVWKSFLLSDGGQKATKTFARTAERITRRADRLIRRFGAAECAVG